MYTLGIANRQKQRTLGYLKQNWINFEEHPSMDGFFDLMFPELDEEGFKNIVHRLKQQGVTIIGADSQLTERNIMKLTKILGEQYNIEDDKSSQGFESDIAKDIIIDLKRTLEIWSTKKYDSAEERFTEYDQDIRDLVDEYEDNMGPSTTNGGSMSDEDAMQATMMDAPSLYEQKIRTKIRKEINKLLNQ
tara:strand:+ start:272 stop:841 length:570 start_codon:yes stop_codon:yes gene_type:complete